MVTCQVRAGKDVRSWLQPAPDKEIEGKPEHRVVCEACGTNLSSKLSVVKRHEETDDHKKKEIAWELKRKQKDQWTVFAATARQQQEARGAKEAPGLHNQLAALLHILMQGRPVTD